MRTRGELPGAVAGATAGAAVPVQPEHLGELGAHRGSRRYLRSAATLQIRRFVNRRKLQFRRFVNRRSAAGRRRDVSEPSNAELADILGVAANKLVRQGYPWHATAVRTAAQRLRQAEADAEDAARYRWLRDECYVWGSDHYVRSDIQIEPVAMWLLGGTDITEHGIDDAIDAAMGESQQPPAVPPAKSDKSELSAKSDTQEPVGVAIAAEQPPAPSIPPTPQGDWPDRIKVRDTKLHDDQGIRPMIYTSAQLLDALRCQYPEVQTAGLRKWVEQTVLDDPPRMPFVPDAFSVIDDAKELHLFEIEVTHPLTAEKGGLIGRFIDEMRDYGWSVYLHIVNRYGHITQMDAATLYKQYLDDIAPDNAA